LKQFNTSFSYLKRSKCLLGFYTLSYPLNTGNSNIHICDHGLLFPSALPHCNTGRHNTFLCYRHLKDAAPFLQQSIL